MTPRRWGSCVCELTWPRGGAVRVPCGSHSKLRGFRHKAASFDAVGKDSPKPGAPAPHKLRFELDGHPRRRQPATSAQARPWARVMAENLQPNEGWLEPRPGALASYPVRAMSSALRSSQAQWLPTRYHSAWTSNPIYRENILEIFLERNWSVQCQSGIFLKDSLTFLPGDLKKIKVYNIFRVLYFQVTPTNDLPGWRMSLSSCLEGGYGGEHHGLFFVFNPPF